MRLLLALVALSMLGRGSSLPRKDFFVLQDRDGPERRIVVVVTRTDERALGCEALANKKSDEEVVSATLKTLSEFEIRDILEECTSLSQTTRRRREAEDCDDDEDCDDEQVQDEAERMWNIIFPGTKWCGSGQTAKQYDDLGLMKDTDSCCRSHDNCNDTMAPGETKNNLTNESRFTKLSCACDDEFYDCLSEVGSVAAHTIGRTYFNILRRSCYAEDYPENKVCKTHRSFLKITCKEYEKDTSGPKVYVWKSPKRYRKLPIPFVG